MRNVFRKKLRVLYLSTFCLLLISYNIIAVPASPHLQEKVQPDGSKVNVKLKGDEFFNWHEDNEGYVVKKDNDDKFWKYTKPAIDKAAFEVIKDAVLGKAKPKDLGLKKRDLPSKLKIAEKIEAKWGIEYVRKDLKKFLKEKAIKDKEKEDKLKELKNLQEEKEAINGGNTQ
jgi:hypothetical protein